MATQGLAQELHRRAVALRLEASELDRLAAKVEAQEQALDASELLDVRQVKERYKVGRDGLLAACGRGELELCRGPRGRIQVRRGALEAWLTAERVTVVRSGGADSEWVERQVKQVAANG